MLDQSGRRWANTGPPSAPRDQLPTQARRWLNVGLMLVQSFVFLDYYHLHDVDPTLLQCWASVVDAGSALRQRWARNPS